MTHETITTEPSSPCIGAEIGNIDLTKPLSPQQVHEIRSALLKYQVVFFRDQPQLYLHLDVGVIGRELLDLSGAHEIGATVSDVADEGVLVPENADCQRRAHPARDVAIAQLRVRIGKAHRAARAGRAERARPSEWPEAARLHEAERELHFSPHALVEEAMRRRNRRRGHGSREDHLLRRDHPVRDRRHRRSDAWPFADHHALMATPDEKKRPGNAGPFALRDSLLRPAAEVLYAEA